MGRGKRKLGGNARQLNGSTAVQPAAEPGLDPEAALLADFNQQHELIDSLAVACTRLIRRRKLDCETQLKTIDAARKLKGAGCFDRLASLTLMLMSISELFEDDEECILDDEQRTEIESLLRHSAPAAISLLEEYPPNRDGNWLSRATEVLVQENLRRFAPLVSTPAHWRFGELVEEIDFETPEGFDIAELLEMLASQLDPRFADFEERMTPLLTEAQRRVSERVGPFLAEPRVIVMANSALRKALVAAGLWPESIATADSVCGLIILSETAALRALELLERGQMDPTILHEMIHLTQPHEDSEDDEDGEEDLEAERIEMGRTTLKEGATEALARRLLALRSNGFAPATERWSAYDVETHLVEKLAAVCHDGADEREAMLLRLLASKRAELMPLLRKELSRPELSEQLLRAIGWLHYYQYKGGGGARLDEQAATSLLESLKDGDYDTKEPTPARAPVVPSRRRSGLAD
jgi:hypothetical protein